MFDFTTITGLILFIMESVKQLYLYFKVFNRAYDIWYFPFQLCSVPMYLSIIILCLRASRYRAGKCNTDNHNAENESGTGKYNTGDYDIGKCSTGDYTADKYVTGKCSTGLDMETALLLFIRDYGMLGGIMALIVHDGLIHPGHFFLTLHGFIWHILLILMSVYIAAKRCEKPFCMLSSFKMTVTPFLICAAIAEAFNILFSKYGDCDMFYISPYHLSSQPVFSSIDMAIGRIPGIIFYLLCVMFGGFIIHAAFTAVLKLRRSYASDNSLLP